MVYILLYYIILYYIFLINARKRKNNKYIKDNKNNKERIKIYMKDINARKMLYKNTERERNPKNKKKCFENYRPKK
jgi:hypothetical protein